MAILPTDFPRPQKLPQFTYDPAFLLGTIPISGSVSSTFDLQGWTQFAIQLDPNGGTFLGGTTVSITAAKSTMDTFQPYYGTTGAVRSTLQMGSTGTQILGPVTALSPLRYVQFTLGGTQDAARILTLFVK